MTSRPVYIDGISILGPGLPDWQTAQQVLADLSLYDAQLVPAIVSQYLTPRNKRRTTEQIQYAICAADRAMIAAAVDEKTVTLAVSASGIDQYVLDNMLRAIASPDKAVSPQQFQNIVLNAAVGHLGIFTGNTGNAITVNGVENNVGVGLLWAYSVLLTEQMPVVLVCFDGPGLSHFDRELCDMPHFAIGLVLQPNKTERSVAAITPELVDAQSYTAIPDAQLTAMMRITPTAHTLPLLRAIARRRDETVILPYTDDGALQVTICFCNTI